MTRRQVSFEVYYLQDGRWRLHARYGPAEGDEAINDAKYLDTTGFEAACVVRDSFDVAHSVSDETIIYHTPTLKARPLVSQIAEDAAAGGAPRAVMPAPEGSVAANAAKSAEAQERAFLATQLREAAAQTQAAEQAAAARPDRRREASAPRRPGTGDLVLKFLAFAIFGLIIASSAAAIVYLALQQLVSLGVGIEKDIAQAVVIGAFVLAFAGAFIPSFRRFVKVASNTEYDQAGSAAVSPGPAAAFDGADLHADAVDEAAALESVEDFDDLTGRLDALDAEPSATAIRRGHEAAQETVAGPDLDLAQDDPDELAAAEAKIANEVETQPIHGESGGDLGRMTLELERVELEARRIVGEAFDDYTRFGLTLFFTGAGEAFARKFKVASDTARDAVTVLAVRLGNPESIAKGFVHNIEEYLIDDRYLAMYQSGRSAAYRRLADENAPLGLDEAIAVWRNPRLPEKRAPEAPTPDPPQAEALGGASGAEGDAVADADPADGDAAKPMRPGSSDKFVAVIFTDIVDSTELQQAKGDHWMMDVIRAHNEIVREGVKRHGGREIKHTGDGIMATFPTAQTAVKASISMQKGFDRFRAAMPDRGFDVRIAISAGEPIHESGDIFGTPVNLAARILSKTEPNAICVAGVVKDLCGPTLRFEQIGAVRLKGFAEAQTICRVVFDGVRNRQAAA